MRRSVLAFSLLVCVAIALSPVPAYSDIQILLEQAWAGCACGFTSISGVNEQSVADDFTPTGDWQVSEVRWTGVFRTVITVQPTRDFVIDFFVDAGGVPAEFPFVSIPVVANAVFNAALSSSFHAYDFSGVLGVPLAFAQGTTFWISITDHGPDKSGGNGMFWAVKDGASPPGFVFRGGDSGTWTTSTGAGVSFTLVGVETEGIVIDIKPGSDPNSINLKSKGNIPVAILGSATFDTFDVDTASFGPNGIAPVHGGHPEDVNDDGFMDLVFHFKTKDTGIVCGDSEATLTGETTGGQQIEGTDSIRTVGCKQ